MLPQCHHNPCQSPRWRWDRTRWLIEHGRSRRKLGRSQNDKFIDDAKKYQKAFARCADECDNYDLSLRFPGIHWAKQIFNDHSARSVRWEIEARLLAGQTFEEIAFCVKSSGPVMEWYEALFFNVQPFLEHRGYITNTVIGESLHLGMKERDYDLMWKVMGYNYGPLVVDLLTTTCNRPTFVSSPDQVRACLKDDFKMTSDKRAMISARTLQLNGFNAQIFIDNFHKIAEQEGAGEGGTIGDAMLLKNIEALVASFPYSTRRVYPKGVDVERIRHYDESSAELRVSELMQVSFGKETEEIKKIPYMKFPEPDKDVQPTHQ